ncbi:MAG TPA: sigma-54 dependent transcriptional regulator, partial [Sedimentisphaerales bacterium]|nr:sigma-54 dependent transcriptional regulator [Sedimentisphaerales bacterium]
MSSFPKKGRILVVDDSLDTLEVLERILLSEGYRVFKASGVSEAIRILNETELDLVITDLKMPHLGGLDMIRHIRENVKNTEVMMITGYPSIDEAVKAVKAGAEEFLPKPFTDSELSSAVQRALNKAKMRRLTDTARPDVISAHGGLLGSSEGMQEVFRAIEKTASASATVLIIGESGTGKELAARAIHYSSHRSAAPFVPVNCGGIPEGLLESELFGHVKGAFTGASVSRAGLFHVADGGTIFLDEIGEMSMPMQVKLLRVLQDREVCMVGSSRPQKVDVRILAATNKDLHSLVRNKLFREDLFYRINVITITMPPLRERGDDILLLVNHFAKKFAAESGKAPRSFSYEALKVLRDYDWPGNVRELENVMQRLTVMGDGEQIDVSDLPSPMRFSASDAGGFMRTLAEMEREYICNVLASVGGNITRAAGILG